MSSQIRRAAFALALLMLIAALSVPGIFLWPIHSWGISNYFEPMIVLSNILRICFIVFPALALVGLFQSRTWPLYFLMAFPSVAWVFGAGAIPFIAWAFAPIAPRGIFITLLNLFVTLVATWLLLLTRRNASKV